MRKTKFARARWAVLSLAIFLAVGSDSLAQTPQNAPQIRTSEFDQQIRDFLEKEVTAHVADIKTLDPPPDRVVGALTTGEFSWGTFMRALGAYAKLAGTSTLEGHDLPQMIGNMAQIELRQGGKTWAQLYAAMALESFGTDLKHNAMWQGFSSEERQNYLQLLDPARFYDAKNHQLIHLPENYFGVAARIAAIDYELGLNTDRASLDDLLNHAARSFSGGALFADDAPPTGRYDRYSNEYARALYDAAEIAGREDLMRTVAPSLTDQMKLWWDLLSPDGYGYSWGRSLGDISYMDTLEIVAFLGRHPQFRPAPLPQMASAYFAAWSSLRRDFDDQRHLLRIFSFGRGDYSYITKAREWQQTTTFLGKAIGAHLIFMQALETENVKSFPAQPSPADVARFQYFRNDAGRRFGVWVVRQGNIHFALPFVTGPKAATSDYEPAPFGFPGFATPVEQIHPCLTPFLELEDGRTIAAADGADELRPAPDGKSVTAVWKRWVIPGGKPGETVDPDLVSEVTWQFEGTSLRRVETLTAGKPLHIRRFWMAIPSHDNHLATSLAGGARIDQLTSAGLPLEVQIKHSDRPFEISAYATGDDALSKGDREPIPLHLILESKSVSLKPGIPESWELTLSVR